MKKAENLFIKTPLEILKYQSLFKTIGGKKRKNDGLIKFYLSVHWNTFGGKKHLTRDVKRKICRQLGIKKSAFWEKWKELERMGFVVRQSIIPYNPGDNKINVKPEFQKYLKRKPRKNKKQRRAVLWHRYLNPISTETFFKLPLYVNGICIFAKDFNLIKEIEARLKESCHPKELEKNPRQFTFPWNRITKYRATKRHEEALKLVAYYGRDINPKGLIGNITQGNILKQEHYFTLLQRKIPEPVQVHYSRVKKVVIRGKKFHASGGKLYLLRGNRCLFEYQRNESCPVGLREGYKNGCSIQAEKARKRGIYAFNNYKERGRREALSFFKQLGKKVSRG